MKKIFTLLFIAIFCFSVSAQDLTGVKIYINPGHGGYDGGNDRNVITIPFAAGDTLGFWESASNLTKGLYLRDLLQQSGATVYMSRTLNRDEDDRFLSEIAEEANANTVDAFLSIHSNAGSNNSVNFLLLLFHGYDNQPTVSESLPQAQAAWPRLVNNQLTYWSHYATGGTNIRGDYSFYGNTSGLGVLRPLVVPGFLSEGSFHDYKPETHRLLNIDYRKLEAENFYRYYCDYFNATHPNTGIIAGWVKGMDQRVDDPRFIYKPGTNDEWLPLNGAKVTLMDAQGAQLNEYTVDDFYNGVFVFYDLAPGSYQLRYEAANHTTKDTTVTVSATTTTFANKLLKNPDLPIYSIVPPDYPDPVQEGGVLPMNNYNFTEISRSNPTWLNGADIRKVVHKDDKFYVLTEESKIHIVNALTYEHVREMDLTGVSGGAILLSDINFTSNGNLLASNMDTINAVETKGRTFKIYYWNDDNAAPQLLFETKNQGRHTSAVVGETFAVSGALWNCQIYTTSVSTATNKAVRVLGFNYQKDMEVRYKYMRDDAAYNEANWGQKIKFTISPFATNNIVVDGENMLPTEYTFEWGATDGSPLNLTATFAETTGYELQNVASGSNFFKNAGNVFMVAPNSNTDLTSAGVVLFNVNDGLSSAKKVSSFLPEGGLGTAATPYMAGFAKVVGYDIELIALADKQGVARFKTVSSGAVANVYASELKAVGGENSVVLSFTLNDNIQGGSISISDGTNVVHSIPLGALAKGVQSIEVPYETVPGGEYSWDVTVQTTAVDRPVKISDNTWPQLQFYSPRGVAVDNSFESEYFGRVYASETSGGKVTNRTTNDGIYILNSALQDITNQDSTAYNGNVPWVGSASPMRLTVAPDGKVYLADFSDAHPGVWIMDPANPSETFAPVFSQTLTKSSTGLASNNGVNVHGSIPHIYVLGTGADTKLYTFDEDYVDATATNTGNILQYNIGELTTPWDSAPSAIIYSDGANGNLQQNFNSSLAPDGRGGWWLSQYRASDMAPIPSLIHVNTQGMVDFNSGTMPTLIGNSYTGGMAVNHDGTRLAMGSQNEVKIFDVTYGEDGVPVLTRIYTINPAMGSNTAGLAFDMAGNVYVISNSSERLGVWALPNADNSFTTPAPATQTITILPVGVIDIEKSGVEAVKVYPNPFESTITLESAEQTIDKVVVYDANGRLVHQESIQSLVKNIDLSNLSSGVYILNIVTEKETLNKRVIKK